VPQIDEFHVQRAHVLWLTGNPDRNGVPRATPALAPGVEFWHTPNGGTRNAVEGKRLKEMGTMAGVHDLLFLRPTRFESGVWGLLFGMEWKKPGGPQPPSRQLSPAQQQMHPRLMRAGFAASVVVDNLAAARAWCFLHGLTISA
jgi:hypothetical protein